MTHQNRGETIGRNADNNAEHTLKDYGATSAATSEAVASQLPGRLNGPADSYRHLLLSAELRRRFGNVEAHIILEGHELQNLLQGRPLEEIAMDRHNNEIGLAIGKNAETWEDVKAEAQRIIDSSARDGSGSGGGAVWRPDSDWKGNPKDEQGNEIPNENTNWPNTDWINGRVEEPYDYPYGGPVDDTGPFGPLDVPAETWSQADVEEVMASAAYRNDWHPQSAVAREKVTAWFSCVYGDDPVKRDATGRMVEPKMKRQPGPGAGAVQARAYTREGDERVRAHTRSRPG